MLVMNYLGTIADLGNIPETTHGYLYTETGTFV